MDDLSPDTGDSPPPGIPELLEYLDEKFPTPVVTDPKTFDEPNLQRDLVARMHRREVVEHLRRLYKK